MPPKKDKSNSNAAPAPLPALDSIESIDAASVPTASKLEMTADEKAYAQAIIAATHDGRLARGPRVVTKDEARNSGSRTKRLVARYYRSQGIAKVDAPAINTRIVSRDGGFAFAIAIVAKETPATDAANGTNTPAAAVAATA